MFFEHFKKCHVSEHHWLGSPESQRLHMKSRHMNVFKDPDIHLQEVID